MVNCHSELQLAQSLRMIHRDLPRLPHFVDVYMVSLRVVLLRGTFHFGEELKRFMLLLAHQVVVRLGLAFLMVQVVNVYG